MVFEIYYIHKIIDNNNIPPVIEHVVIGKQTGELLRMRSGHLHKLCNMNIQERRISSVIFKA